MKELLDEAYDEEAEVYLGGLGFLPSNPKDLIISKIKKYSNIFSFAIIFPVILNKILLLLFNYLLGDSSVFNPSWVSSGVTVFSFLLAILVVYLLDKPFYSKKRFFFKINANNLTTVIIITLSFWVFANVIAYILEDFFRIIGIINLPVFNPVDINEHLILSDWFTVLIMTVLQELFFRGLVLYRLREYGDKFAIFCVSLLFAFYSAELLLGVKWFIISLPLCYFTLRYNNIFVIVLTRLVCTYSLEFVEIIFGSFGNEIGNVILVLFGVASLLLGLLSYFKLDFSFYVSDDNLSNKDKVLNFVNTIPFSLLVIVAIFQAQGVLQFVG